MKTETIALGGGCFWCTEAVFLMLPSVRKVTPGYAGGETENPTYEEVGRGNTGHAEVIKIEYDPKIAGMEKILELFFAVHDPTQINRQGNDTGTQYRSIILFTNERQKAISEKYMAKIQENYKGKIATEIKKLGVFYPAEDYHRKYFENNPNQPYCRFVVWPKVELAKKIIGK
jgi:peptide-methionine (S)-S-oxide reductase